MQDTTRQDTTMQEATRNTISDPWANCAGPTGLAVIGLLTAAAIHFSVVGEHLHEWAPLGISMAAMGFAEALLTVILARRPSRRAWIGVGLVSLGTVALWTLSRTAGLPVGPHPWQAEAVGRADTIATIAELVTVAAAVRALTARGHGTRHPRLLSGTALAVTVPFTLLALSGSSAEMSASAAPGVAPTMATATSIAAMRTPTGVPSGSMPGMPTGSMPAAAGLDATTCPNLGGLMPMPDGMVMQPTPNRPPTPAEQQAADVLVAQTKAEAQRFTSLAAAQAAGYVPETNPNAKVVHWIDKSVVRAKDILDPAHPSSLIYVNSVRGPVLVGAMYLSAGPCQPGPDPAGPLFQWHAHANLCFGTAGQVVGHADAAGHCASGRSIGTSSFMLHVWTAPSLGNSLQPELPRSTYAQVIRTGRP